ncbi:hypothetical protein KBC79_01510 [Candidatus Woesebacteria bacterium]|nr:hypothetical protein [Candidatus Woesebacteria bacterium]
MSKKPNYQRLWRNCKKQEILSHNFAEDIVTVARNFVSKRLKAKDLTDFEGSIQFIRDKYMKLSVDSTVKTTPKEIAQ